MDLPDSYKEQLAQRKPAIDEKDFWVDPDASCPPGLLLSDRIMFYCKQVNLIWPYDEKYVEPASYTLHAGREYLIAVRPGQIESHDLEAEGKVIIPPNGLIFIRFFEEVNIPHYMIARFNLRVTQVYRGLLLGTGPQVEPGYKGLLGCPIHNFTDEDKTIEFFERLVTIDFEKTTRLGEAYFNGMDIGNIPAERFAGMRSGVTKVGGIDGWSCKIFNKRGNASFQSFLPPGQSVRSSVQALNESVKKAHEDINIQANTIQLYRRVGLGSLVGILIAVIIGILTVVLPLYTDLKNDISSRFSGLQHDIGDMKQAIGALQEGNREGPPLHKSHISGEKRHSVAEGKDVSKDPKAR